MRKERIGRALGEFALIVTGVLCALTVENWAQSQEERSVEGTYIRSLQVDAEYNEGQLRELAEDIAAVREHIDLSATILASDAHEYTAPASLAAIYLATRGNYPALLDNAYRDLQATGNLRLIRDPEMRHNIVAYHLEVQRWGVDNQALIRANRLPYRNSVRSRIPLALQESIRSDCPLRVVPATCELEAWTADLEPVLRRVRGDAELERFLTLWASSALSSANYVSRLLLETQEFRQRLQAYNPTD